MGESVDGEIQRIDEAGMKNPGRIKELCMGRMLGLLGVVVLGLSPSLVRADAALDKALGDAKAAADALEKRCGGGGGGSKLVMNTSDNDLVELLKELGYSSVTVKDAGKITFKMEGMNVVLFNLKGTLQLYVGVSGAPTDLEKINKWNTNKRFSRAYLDKDRDPVLESDLVVSDGTTREALSGFIQLYGQSLVAFRREVLP